MDRALRANVIAKSGKAVENAGDIDTVLLDKTGTITIGNRKATNFYPLDGIDQVEFMKYSTLSSLADSTPEGKSIIELAEKNNVVVQKEYSNVKFIPFTAETRMSGVDLPEGTQIRKGAWDAIKTYANRTDGAISQAENLINKIAENGGLLLQLQ